MTLMELYVSLSVKRFECERYSFLSAEFAVGSRAVVVSEPEDGASASVSLIVERTGGTTGVVEVSWSLTFSNGESISSATDHHETSMVFPVGRILFDSWD